MLTTLPFLLIYLSLTALLVNADIRYGLLPDKFLCPLLWAGLLFQLLSNLIFCRVRLRVRWPDILPLPLFTGAIGLSAGVKEWDMAM